MKRILIIGPCGSGKSVFSRKLKDKLKINVYHLDNLFWNVDGTSVDKEVFLNRLNEVLNKDEWIIDGNFISSLDLRMQYADTVFYLDYPIELCLESVKERQGQIRSDLPWDDSTPSEGFYDYVRDFNKNNKQFMLDILDKYSDVDIKCFKTRQEAQSFLDRI